MPRYTEKAEQLTLPVIPLHDAVAFPSVPIDFESNDTAAVAAGEAAPQFGQTVLLVYIKDDNGETPVPEKLATVGTVARIRQSIKNREAGKVRFICECRSRATVSEYHKKGRLITASREIIDDATAAEDDPGVLLDSAEQRIFDIRSGSDHLSASSGTTNSTEAMTSLTR